MPGGLKIQLHVKIGLIAAMILTSMFIRKFSGGKIGKKVAFISSGAAFAASPEDSIYCSSKARLICLPNALDWSKRTGKMGLKYFHRSWNGGYSHASGGPFKNH